MIDIYLCVQIGRDEYLGDDFITSVGSVRYLIRHSPTPLGMPESIPLSLGDISQTLPVLARIVHGDPHGDDVIQPRDMAQLHAECAKAIQYAVHQSGDATELPEFLHSLEALSAKALHNQEAILVAGD